MSLRPLPLLYSSIALPTTAIYIYSQYDPAFNVQVIKWRNTILKEAKQTTTEWITQKPTAIKEGEQFAKWKKMNEHKKEDAKVKTSNGDGNGFKSLKREVEVKAKEVGKELNQAKDALLTKAEAKLKSIDQPEPKVTKAVAQKVNDEKEKHLAAMMKANEESQALAKAAQAEASRSHEEAEKLKVELIAKIKHNEEQWEHKVQTLEREWAKEVQAKVDAERSGRLAKLKELETEAKRLEIETRLARNSQSSSKTAHRIALIASNLQQDPTQLHNLPVPDPFAAEVIQAVPRGRVHTVPELTRMFRSIERPIRRVALVPEEGGFEAHIMSIIASWITFKRRGLVTGDDTFSILARGEHYLGEGNVNAAVREINALQGPSRKLAQKWLEKARLHLEAHQAIDILELRSKYLALQQL